MIANVVSGRVASASDENVVQDRLIPAFQQAQGYHGGYWLRQPNGDGHAVLTVRTSGGDFILDNLEARVLAWNESEYTFLKRQSSRNSGAWVAISDSRATAAVGSVR